MFGPEYERALEILRAIRHRLHQEAVPAAERRALLTTLASAQLLDALRAGHTDEIDDLLRAVIGRDTSIQTLGIRAG